MQVMDTNILPEQSGEKSLEPHIQDNQVDGIDKVSLVESQIRDCYGRVVYSHKTHEKCAEILLKQYNRIKLAQISLAAITTGSFLVTIFEQGKISAIVGTICSAILLMINTYTKDKDLGEIAQKHRNTANDLWNVRESYLSLIADIPSNCIDFDNIRKRRDELQKELASIYQSSPATNSPAYKQAQEALQVNEELTFSDEEIDKLLPKSLRKVKLIEK
jgi:hypothetical protein